MKLRFEKSELKGTVSAPPSKSMAHRLLLCAALSEGESFISPIDHSDDVNATLNCLKSLGASYKQNGDRMTVYGLGKKDVDGSSGTNHENIPVFPCNESGSTLRFFIPVSLLYFREAIFTGSEKLFERPLSVYEELFEKQNIEFEKSENRFVVKGKLNPGRYEVPGHISSQFISGLLFALPLLSGNSEIIVKEPLESESYIDLTIGALKKFSVSVQSERTEDARILRILGNQKYEPQEVFVEGDFSNSAFFDALNDIGKNDVRVEGLSENSIQGDRIYKKYFSEIESGNPVIDIKDCPDLAPVLITLAAVKNGAEFHKTKRLQYKESDRGNVMAEELRKFGADIIVGEDAICVRPKELHAPSETVEGHGDHRIVMALSILLLEFGGELSGAEAVKKSFPKFFETLKLMGGKISEVNES